MSSNFLTDEAPGTSSLTAKADSFFADVITGEENVAYPSGYPGYPYTHTGFPPPPPGLDQADGE